MVTIQSDNLSCRVNVFYKKSTSGETTSNTYTLSYGLAYNTRGYFASCVVFFRAPKRRGKIQAMSKMSARIIC